MDRDKPTIDSEAAFRDVEPIVRAVDRAVRRALAQHKKMGNPVATWRDGKVVWVPPEEIPDFPEAEPES